MVLEQEFLLSVLLILIKIYLLNNFNRDAFKVDKLVGLDVLEKNVVIGELLVLKSNERLKIENFQNQHNAESIL